MHDVDSSGNPEVTQEVTVELLPVIRAEIIDALASQLVKEFVGALVEELPIGSGIGTTDESPQRILLGYDGTKAAEIKESVAAKGGGTFTSFRDSFVWEGHKIEFTGAWLEKGAGPPHFLEKSKLNWDGKAMIFDGTRWIDR